MLLPLAARGRGGGRKIKQYTKDEVIHADNVPGELYLTGPNIMLGYLNDIDATEELLYRHCVGRRREEVWYKTGDLLMTQENGREFFHLGRVADLIWYRVNDGDEGKGETRYGDSDDEKYILIRPVVVEDVLGRHDAVYECAIVGVDAPARTAYARTMG